MGVLKALSHFLTFFDAWYSAQPTNRGLVSWLTTHTHTRLTAPFSGTTWVSQYQKGKTNLDFTEARDSEWQWHQLSHMQVCTSLQTDNHTSTPPLSFLQAGCPSCRPTNSVRALKANGWHLGWQLAVYLFRECCSRCRFQPYDCVNTRFVE